MVWIHGGSLTRGSGSNTVYDGGELAKKGVVLVTINYRLGAFGYMAHPELSAETVSKSSGNYGTSDQIQALRWVQENIAAFGGDANNVTVLANQQALGASTISLVRQPPPGYSIELLVKAAGNFADFLILDPGIDQPKVEELRCK